MSGAVLWGLLLVHMLYRLKIGFGRLSKPMNFGYWITASSQETLAIFHPTVYTFLYYLCVYIYNIILYQSSWVIPSLPPQHISTHFRSSGQNRSVVVHPSTCQHRPFSVAWAESSTSKHHQSEAMISFDTFQVLTGDDWVWAKKVKKHQEPQTSLMSIDFKPSIVFPARNVSSGHGASAKQLFPLGCMERKGEASNFAGCFIIFIIFILCFMCFWGFMCFMFGFWMCFSISLQAQKGSDFWTGMSGSGSPSLSSPRSGQGRSKKWC